MQRVFVPYWLVIPSLLTVVLITEPTAAEGTRHDGFFLSGELGVGYLSMSGTASGGAHNVDSKIAGGAISGGLLLGSTLAEGWVIGAATQNHSVWSPTLEYGDKTEELDGSLGLSLMGPFAQFYPDPKEGLFFRLAPGYALVYATDSEVESFATGFGVAAAVGNDWWIGKEWSMGVAGRFTYAHLKYDTRVTGPTVEQAYNAFAPCLLLTLTMH
jgi:hypothetical protein